MNPFEAIFYPIFGGACLLATIATFMAARTKGVVASGMLLAVGVFTVWAGMFFGSEFGYRAWQAMPDPPPEAYADTLPLGALLFGWVPGSFFCGVLFGTLKIISLLTRPKTSPALDQSDALRSDTGNPYQGPE